MRKRLLGRTGVLVSEFALGTMTFGQEAPEIAAMQILDAYVDGGGNLIDTADVYPPVGPKGTSEEIIGRWLSGRPAVRDSIILATKCRGRMDGSGNSEGLSRRWIIRACEGSLRRLQTDHIDLYQAHQWDPATPIEETLAAFDVLVRSGKVRYIGVSNFTGWQLERTVMTARHLGFSVPVSLQPQYNMLAREIEWELVPVCIEEGLGILPWGPLAQGWLSGKYTRDMAPSGATRLGEDPNVGDRRCRASRRHRARRATGTGRAALAGRPSRGRRAAARGANRGSAARQPDGGRHRTERGAALAPGRGERAGDPGLPLPAARRRHR